MCIDRICVINYIVKLIVVVFRMKVIGKGLYILFGDENIGGIRKKNVFCDKLGILMIFFIWCIRKGVEIDNIICFVV